MNLEIKARENSLEREQKQWRLEKIELERELPRLRSEKVALSKHVKSKRTELDGLKRAVNTLQVVQANLGKENRVMEIRLKEGQDTLNRHATKSIEIENQIAVRKEQSDKEVEEYFTESKSKLDERLGETIMLIDKAKIQLKSTENQITLQQDILKNVKIEASQAVSDFKGVEDGLTVQKANLEVDIAPLKEDKQRLQTQINTLTQQKADITKEYIDLERRNTALKAYEEKAWKLLNAKDEELQQKEQVIKQKEQFTPNSRSFLPPTTD